MLRPPRAGWTPEGDPDGRENAYAFLRGRSARTAVLLGHIDTAAIATSGCWSSGRSDPPALAQREEQLAALDPSLAADLAAHPGDWMFGRGVVDMKSGVAATIAVMRAFARAARDGEPPPLSIVLLATPDEENASAGILRAVRFLLRLRELHGLTYVGAINTDYTAARSFGDPHRYVYTGTVGKLLPSLLVVGRRIARWRALRGRGREPAGGRPHRRAEHEIRNCVTPCAGRACLRR